MKRSFFRMAAMALLLTAPFLLPASWRSRISGGLRDAFAPAQKALADLRNAVQDLHNAPSKEALAEEAARLRIEVNRLQTLERENRALKTQLGFQLAAPYRLIAAEVIARDMNTWWHTMRIGKGALDGLRPDMPVLSPDGLIGKTVAVSGRTSDVRLLVDPDSSVSTCLQRLDAFGIVRGAGVSQKGDALCRMTFIVKDLSVRPGEEVVTSGLSVIFPRGLLVGYVSRAYPDRSGLFQIADVIPAADFNALRVVFVLDQATALGADSMERP